MNIETNFQIPLYNILLGFSIIIFSKKFHTSQFCLSNALLQESKVISLQNIMQDLNGFIHLGKLKLD